MSFESTGSNIEDLIEESGNEIGTEFEMDLKFPDEVLSDQKGVSGGIKFCDSDLGASHGLLVTAKGRVII